MLISKIYLKNIRCFKEITIDLSANSENNMWLTILGDNAVGKSTILKCISMGLCDQSSAAGLMKEEKAGFIRKGELNGNIILTLQNRSKTKGYEITTTLKKLTADGPEILEQSLPDNIFPWQDIFLCGYGVQIGDGGGDTWQGYKSLEAVYTLFNTSSELQNTEAIMFKQRRKVRDWLSEKLQKILLLEDYPSIEYDNKGMHVYGPWGKSRINELSDGYRRVIQIIVDFFGWQIVADRITKKNDSIKGILLIDELETHLHPRLQRFIAHRLSTYLPDVQIIITTHSPLIALGTSDLDFSLILELDLKDIETNNIRNEHVNPSKYKGFTVDQILTSSAFDMPIARSAVTGDKIIRFRSLFLKESRDIEEEKEFKKLQHELESEVPPYGEQEQDRKRQIELRQLIEELNNKIKGSNDKDSGQTATTT